MTIFGPEEKGRQAVPREAPRQEWLLLLLLLSLLLCERLMLLLHAVAGGRWLLVCGRMMLSGRLGQWLATAIAKEATGRQN